MMKREQFAKPSPGDHPTSFRRNIHVFSPNYGHPHRFPDEVIPVSYYFAERLDHGKRGIPRASYFILDPETEGKTISERVSNSLRKRFDSEARKSRQGPDLAVAENALHAAWNSESTDNWTAAIQHAAEAHALGSEAHKSEARLVLERIAGSALAYRDFAPAPGRNEIQSDMGPITVPSYLSKDDVRHYTNIARSWKRA